MVSCARMHTAQKDTSSLPVVSRTGSAKTDNPPINEVKEKIVGTTNKPADPHNYFVIIGSFRSQDNARKYQEEIAYDGFTSMLLKNEEGLYRVSVKATDDILTARNEIRNIRSKFNKYNDTWLLISIK